MLTAAGCRYGQGFLFSPPVRIDEALKLLETRGVVVSDDPDVPDTTRTLAEPLEPGPDGGRDGSREAPGGNAFTADT
jgi:hypothetical protein